MFTLLRSVAPSFGINFFYSIKAETNFTVYSVTWFNLEINYARDLSQNRNSHRQEKCSDDKRDNKLVSYGIQ